MQWSCNCTDLSMNRRSLLISSYYYVPMMVCVFEGSSLDLFLGRDFSIISRQAVLVLGVSGFAGVSHAKSINVTGSWHNSFWHFLSGTQAMLRLADKCQHSPSLWHLTQGAARQASSPKGKSFKILKAIKENQCRCIPRSWWKHVHSKFGSCSRYLWAVVFFMWQFALDEAILITLSVKLFSPSVPPSKSCYPTDFGSE